MAHITYRVSGVPKEMREERPRRETRQFRDNDEGRKAAEAFRATLDDARTVYDVEYRIDGRKITKTFGRKKEADAHTARVEVASADGDAVDPRKGRVTFGAYAETWLATRLVNGRPLTPMTRRGYSGLLKRNILPTFANATLSSVTAERIAQWHVDVITTKGEDQAAKSYRLVRAILNTAASERRIPRNPCAIKGAGIEHAPERPMVDTVTVLDLADAITPRLRALVLLGAFVTLRSGELLGLRRSDVDLLRRKLCVRQQIHEVTGGRVVIPRAKSEAGLRTLAIHEHAVPALTDHLASYAEPGEDGLIFTGPTGGPLYRSQLSREWAKACAAVGVTGLHIHDLRHHAATLTARKDGITTKELMARLGHSSPRAALIYQHATEERDREIAGFLDEVIEAAEAKRRERTEGTISVLADHRSQPPAG